MNHKNLRRLYREEGGRHCAGERYLVVPPKGEQLAGTMQRG
jgi:hypothetical protein